MSQIDCKNKRGYVRVRPLSSEIQTSLDQIYRSNPYPSRFEYETYSQDLDCDVLRIRNWFNNQRRRDFKNEKLCRLCRFFKAPIDEVGHAIAQRPCVNYWSLPTVAPPTIVDPPPTTAKSYSSPSEVSSSSSQDTFEEPQRNNEQIISKLEVDQITQQQQQQSIASVAAVPSAVSLTIQQSMYNFQQPLYNPEPTSWYQPAPVQYPLDMCAGSNWMMRSSAAPYWPIPLDFSQTSELSQIPLPDYHSSNADWRSTHFHRSYPYPSIENYPYYPSRPELPIDSNYYEEGSSNN